MSLRMPRKDTNIIYETYVRTYNLPPGEIAPRPVEWTSRQGTAGPMRGLPTPRITMAVE